MTVLETFPRPWSVLRILENLGNAGGIHALHDPWSWPLFDMEINHSLLTFSKIGICPLKTLTLIAPVTLFWLTPITSGMEKKRLDWEEKVTNLLKVMPRVKKKSPYSNHVEMERTSSNLLLSQLVMDFTALLRGKLIKWEFVSVGQWRGLESLRQE